MVGSAEIDGLQKRDDDVCDLAGRRWTWAKRKRPFDKVVPGFRALRCMYDEEQDNNPIDWRDSEREVTKTRGRNKD